MLYEKFLKPLLFRMDPEEAHERMMGLLQTVQALPLGKGLARAAWGGTEPGLETEVFGLKFPNVVGLAAGFDKDCKVFGMMGSLGFGFVEVGSLTLRPQPGNPKPRIFRLPEYDALINRLGFNSEGAEAAQRRLKAAFPFKFPMGINLGLNADCPRDKAHEEYAQTFKMLEPYGDYFVVNVSSPNTLGLRDLQERIHLERILSAIAAVNTKSKPLLVKISPDLSDELLPSLIELIGQAASGVIATNTTIARPGVPADEQERRGGLSGAPLRARSTELIGKIFRLSSGKIPIIGVGGVFTGGDAYEKIRAGASLVQLYTGLVYRGPSAARRIQRELSSWLRKDGFKSVAEAVGTEGKS
ncbi:MAG: quinone-dependent dihydroorotate dehydrogenase [Elusimicrobia bacterium]|nr:quinone-dependent dihydroorotate dehydrogenase [Elusimicrobiota bacterium]